MPKFDEDTHCHFFPDEECKFLLTEEDMKHSLNSDDWEEGDILANRPYEYTWTCTNCLLSRIIQKLNRKEDV